MAEIQVRSVAAGWYHSLALTWDGRVYLWGGNNCGQLGHGDELDRPSPALVQGLEGVRGIAAAGCRSLAVTDSGAVFEWGELLLPAGTGAMNELRPVVVVDGFGVVRVRRVCAGDRTDFAIGEDGELFSWRDGEDWLLGHGDRQNRPSPKRIEALRGIRVSRVSVGSEHALALAEDGLVYAWGENVEGALLGNPHAERELLPKLVEALRGVRVGSIAAADNCSYALADTGEVWAWGFDDGDGASLGHGEEIGCDRPKSAESLRGVKGDALAADRDLMLALADDGSVYAWGSGPAAASGALGLGPSVSEAGSTVSTPQRLPALLVAYGR
jgi:alpha-tubulin suppressor-like RCC1 family protein